MALSALLGVLVACAGTSRTAPRDRADRPHKALLYVNRTTLYSYDLSSGRRQEVTQLPSGDVAVSPDGTRFVAVKETSPAGPGPEGFRRPALVLGDIGPQAASRSITLGPGRSPLWSPDGQQIAAIAGAPGGMERVVAYALDGAGRRGARPVLPRDRWSILGWSDGRVLGLGAHTGASLGVPGELDDAESLGLMPSQVWGVSPVTPRLLVVKGKTTHFFTPNQKAGPYLHFGKAVLGDGSWSPDGRWVAAALLQPQASFFASKLVVIDASSGRVQNVPRSTGAQGGVVWDAAAESFAYVRARRPTGRLEAVVCTTDLSCRTTFAWSQGVYLLGFASS